MVDAFDDLLPQGNRDYRYCRRKSMSSSGVCPSLGGRIDSCSSHLHPALLGRDEMVSLPFV